VLRALGAARTRFVVVGGAAINLQGVPRFTADLDLAVALERENLIALGAALEGLGLVPRLPVAIEDLADAATVLSWIEERNLRAFTFQDPNNPLKQVDLLLASPVPYERIEQTADVVSAQGLELRVASLEVLIEMKSGTGRSQDESDVAALRRIQELENGEA